MELNWPWVAGVFALCAGCVVAPGAWAGAANPTIRDLAPAQVYAVSVASGVAPVALPPPGVEDWVAFGADVPAAPLDLDFRPAPGLGTLPPDYGRVGLRWPARMSSGTRRLSAPGGGSWTLGAESWRYASLAGPDLTVGSESTQAAAWSTPVRLAGVGLRSGPAAGANAWQYALSVGALDETPPADTSGGLSYGSAASNSVLRYALAPNVALDSQVQWAPDLSNVGLGGSYSLPHWGAWRMGVSRAASSTDGSTGSAWGRLIGYQVDLYRGFQVSWVNQQRGAGYSDLSSYRSTPLVGDSVRNQWQATLPLGRWGNLAGSYAQVDDAMGIVQQTVGVSQQFQAYSSLRVRLEANRDLASGGYDLGVRFSLPVD